MDVPEKLFTKYNIPFALLPQVEAKRHLLSAMLNREKKIIGGSEPIYAEVLLPQVSMLSEEKLDALLEPRIYTQMPSAMDAPPKHRSKDAAIEMVAQFENLLLENAKYKWTPKKAAKHLYPKWQKIFRNPENLARTYFKHRKAIKRLQEFRDDRETRRQIVADLINEYRSDADAMLLLGMLLFYGQLHESSAGGAGSRDSEAMLDMIFGVEHPFIGKLILAINTTDVLQLWIKTRSVFQKVKNVDTRKSLFAGSHRDPEEFVNSVLKGLKRFNLY